jgi:hypothetical protein
MVDEAEHIIPPDRFLELTELRRQHAAHDEDIFELRTRRERYRERNLLIELVVVKGEHIAERETGVIDEALPFNADPLRQDRLVPLSDDIGVGILEDRHEIVLGGRDKRGVGWAGELQLIAVEEPAIMIAEAEPVVAGQRHVAIVIGQEEEVTILDRDLIDNASGD